MGNTSRRSDNPRACPLREGTRALEVPRRTRRTQVTWRKCRAAPESTPAHLCVWRVLQIGSRRHLVRCRARSAILGNIQTERTAALLAVSARRASRCSARSAVMGVSVARRAGSALPGGTARTARQGLTRMGAGRHACCAPKVNSALLLVLAISRRARTAPPGDIRWQLDYQTYLVAQIAALENTERWRDLLTLRHAKIVAVDDSRHTRVARGAKNAIRVAVR